ncbi:MAG: hypothetical protein ABEH47_03360 [Haloferacaceae archaeon]
MRRVIAATLVAVLVVSAGCGGTASDGTTTAPTTEGPTATATPTATERTPVAVTGFPAVDGTAVNETALVATHDRALSNVSYTIALEQRVGDTDVRVDVERAGDEELLTTAINGTPETDYTNGSVEYIRTEHENGSVTYRNRSVTNATPYTGVVVVDDFVESADHAPVGVTTYDGAEVVELTAAREDIKPSALVPNATVDSFESRILVDREGRIRLFTYRITGTTNGEPFSYRLRFRVSKIGSTTVERPEWVDRA